MIQGSNGMLLESISTNRKTLLAANQFLRNIPVIGAQNKICVHLRLRLVRFFVLPCCANQIE
jgi:hypothetical protein